MVTTAQNPGDSLEVADKDDSSLLKMDPPLILMEQEDTPDDRRNPVRCRWKQVLIWIFKLLCSTLLGLCFGYSAVLATQFKTSNGHFQLDDEMISWVVSSFSFAAIPGCMVGGVAADWFGRRRTAIISLGCASATWVLTAIAQNVAWIIAGRVLTAVAVFAFHINILIFVDEMADPKLRDFIMFSSAPFFNAGIAIMSAMMTVNWRIPAGMTVGYCGVLMILVSLVPESPTWLVKKNRHEEARRCLEWIWGSGSQKQVQDELTQLRRQVYFSKTISTAQKANWFRHFLERTKYLLKPRLIKPFLIMLVFNILHHLCGQDVYTNYPADVIANMKNINKGLDATTTNTVVSVVRIVVGILGAISIFKVGRRTMSITSGICCAVSCFAISALLHFHSSQMEDWLTLTMLICFVSSGEYGIRLLPVYMVGETQPSEFRGLFTGIIVTVNQSLVALMIKLFPWYSQVLGIQGLFLLFGVCCFIFAVYAFLLLPETQGRTLYEVEEYFSQPNIFWFTRKK